MTTFRRTKTEITIETTKVTVTRNSEAKDNPPCEHCGQPIPAIPVIDSQLDRQNRIYQKDSVKQIAAELRKHSTD